MIDVVGDLWTYDAQLRVITTNGAVNSRGLAVMGRGCAKEAAAIYPSLQRELGVRLQREGNHAFLFCYPDETPLATMPVKHHWGDDADLALIERSAYELKAIADAHKWTRVVLPRPGCGNGNLQYEDVRPILARALDKRFHVITFDLEKRRHDRAY
jgi:hypothetical protein